QESPLVLEGARDRTRHRQGRQGARGSACQAARGRTQRRCQDAQEEQRRVGRAGDRSRGSGRTAGAARPQDAARRQLTMGRLDDIAARNKQAMGGDNLLVKAVNKIGGDAKPSDDVPAYTLPSQRKSGTAMWKVLILMVLL